VRIVTSFYIGSLRLIITCEGRRGHISRRSTLDSSSPLSDRTNPFAFREDDTVPEKSDSLVIYSKAVRLSDDAAGERQNLSKKEHKEEGQVKLEVYMQYLKSASLRGFFLFVSAVIAEQCTILLGNMALRAWGEQNRIAGSNHFGYALLFGLFSLVSALFGAAAILLLVFSTLRSAKYFHDSVCP
jgi:ATP-binding cassette subfamily C (CFTR/MRP) protein 1